MRKDLGRQDPEEIPFSDSSRMKLKRSHQWLTEPSGSGLFSNKRQVVETDATRLDCLTPPMNLSAWDDSLVPRQLPDCLFDLSNPQHTSDLLGRDISPLDCQHIEEGRKYIQEQSNTVSSVGFPVVHAVYANLDTIRNVKLNEDMLEPKVQLYNEGSLTSLETGPSYNRNQDSSLFFGQTFSNIDKNFILPGPLDCRADGNFIRHFNNEGVGVIPTRDIYEKGDGNVLPTFHPFEKGVENFVSMDQSLQKADCNVLLSTSSSYKKGHENFMSLLSCDKVSENLFMTESYNHKENANVLSRGRSPWMEGGKVAFMVSSQDRADQNNDRISHGDRSKTITFGDYQEEPTKGSSFRGSNNYGSFSHASATAKDPLHMEAEEIMSIEFRNPHYTSPRADTLLVPESKESKTAKRGSTNSFPSNVKSLLSTGMFDGVTVKYYSWSREKNLKGIIKGTGYLCGCNNCNHNKVLNAYEFEQHANCKTKHPNNHIYFENGKTIYGVVQELKNTPQEKLFDAIQNVTGSDINHKNFNTWKASYQVASLELQRIYGKDIVTLGS